MGVEIRCENVSVQVSWICQKGKYLLFYCFGERTSPDVTSLTQAMLRHRLLAFTQSSEKFRVELGFLHAISSARSL